MAVDAAAPVALGLLPRSRACQRRRPPARSVAATSRSSPSCSARRSTSTARTSCAARCREYRDAFGPDAVSYAGKAFLCLAMAAARTRRGDAPRRRDRRRAARRASRRVSRLHASCSTATTSPTPSCGSRSTRASAGSSPTRSTSSTASSASWRRAARAVGARAGHARASRPTRTTTSRPAPTTRSSASPCRPVPRSRPPGAWRSPTPMEFGGLPLPHRLADLAARLVRPGRGGRRAPRRRRRSAPRGEPSRELNLGGGLGVPYTADELDAPSIADVRIVRRRPTSTRACADAGLDPMPRLTVEAGRSIAGPAGITLYEVGTIKEIPGVRTYVAVDGGMSDNPRPATYGARYEAFVPVAGRSATTARRVARGQALRAGRRPRRRRPPSRRSSRSATSSPPRSPARTATRWRPTTTWCPARRWSSCATAVPESWCGGESFDDLVVRDQIEGD